MKLHYQSIKKCPLCEGIQFTDILTKHTQLRNFKEEASQTYSICNTCQFIFTRNPLHESTLREYYASNTQERRSSADENEKRHIEEQLSFLKRTPLVPQGNIVLEIGANNGTFLEALAPKDSYYVEPNKESLVILEKKPRLKNFLTILEKAKKTALQFDQIILLHTLEHIVNPKSFINHWKKYLREGGVFFIEVPDFTFADNNTDEFIFEHVNFFSERTLSRLFADCGLSLVASEISLDQNYPACPKYTLRMIAKKSSASVSSNISHTRAVFRKKEGERERFFKNINLQLKKFGVAARIGIYSASWLSMECLQKTNLLRHNIVAIFDRDQKKQKVPFEGLTVRDPSTLDPENIDHLFVLNEGYENEIREYLKFRKFPLSKVIFWSECR